MKYPKFLKDNDTILKLYTLGLANSSIHPFVLSKNGILVAQKDSLVIPTLHTRDPKFPEWFENVYKKEYTRRRDVGKEWKNN